MASFRLSFTLWYHSSTFPYPTTQWDGQWAAMTPWYLLFASSFSHFSPALVWVFHGQQDIMPQDKPAPPWAFSSKGIFCCSSICQKHGYVLQSGLYRHCRGISALEMSVVRSCTFKQSITPPVWKQSFYLCRIWHGRAVGVWIWKGQVYSRVSSEPGCIIKALAHFRQELGHL